jgi:hypothetical protein
MSDDIDFSKYRLTPLARREQVAELAAEGKSQREIAKELGVSHTQVQKDLATKLPDHVAKAGDGNQVAADATQQKPKRVIRVRARGVMPEGPDEISRDQYDELGGDKRKILEFIRQRDLQRSTANVEA